MTVRFELLVLLVLLSVTGGCTRVEPKETPGPPSGPLAQESWDIELQVTETGVIRLEMEAARMRRYDDPDSLYTIFDNGETGGDRVTAQFFDSLGQFLGILRAEYVRFNEDTRAMIAMGDVVLETGEGRKLESEQLFWDEEAGRVHAPGFVSLTTDEANIQGYEFDSTEDLLNWELQRPTGRIQLPDQ